MIILKLIVLYLCKMYVVAPNQNYLGGSNKWQQHTSFSGFDRSQNLRWSHDLRWC